MSRYYALYEDATKAMKRLHSLIGVMEIFAGEKPYSLMFDSVPILSDPAKFDCPTLEIGFLIVLPERKQRILSMKLVPAVVLSEENEEELAYVVHTRDCMAFHPEPGDPLKSSGSELWPHGYLLEPEDFERFCAARIEVAKTSYWSQKKTYDVFLAAKAVIQNTVVEVSAFSAEEAEQTVLDMHINGKINWKIPMDDYEEVEIEVTDVQ